MYRNKLQISLTVGALDFCPFHITSLNFSKTCREFHIPSVKSIAFYFLKNVFNESGASNNRKQISSFSPVGLLLALHESKEVTLLSLSRKVFTGFSAVTLVGPRLSLLIYLVSYIAEIPRAECITSVKTSSPCHRCPTERNDFNNYLKGHGRSFAESKGMLSQLLDAYNNDVQTKNLSTLHQFQLFNQFLLAFFQCHFNLSTTYTICLRLNQSILSFWIFVKQ